MVVFAVTESHVCLSTRHPGREISSTVSDGFQLDAESAIEPHRLRWASAVSSKTITLVRSLTSPFFFVTARR